MIPDIQLGNPAYHNSDSESDASKLYIDITKKALSLKPSHGIINFLTPVTIIRDGKRKFSIKIPGLKRVDHTANDDFNVGVHIIEWTIDGTYKGDLVEVINRDGSIDIRHYSDSLVDKNDKLLINLFERLKDNPSKLFISDQQINNKPKSKSKNNQVEKDNIYKYKVFMNYYKDKIRYSKIIPKLLGKRKIFISISKTYNQENIKISNEDFGQLHLMIDVTDLTNNQIENIKSFLFNEISVNICDKYKKLYGTGFNNMLYVFPEIDINIKYSNKEVQNIFGLSDNEVFEILK